MDAIGGVVALISTALLAVVVIGGRQIVEKAADKGVQHWFRESDFKEELRQEQERHEQQLKIQQDEHQDNLRRQLDELRGTLRQEMRFKSYGLLNASMRELARYGWQEIQAERAREISMKLSDWYFSDEGGLLLTEVARTYYFTLQDVLEIIGGKENWTARSADPERDFKTALDHYDLRDVDVILDDNSVAWPDAANSAGEQWRADMKDLCQKDWGDLSSEQQFAVIQQVSSRLRTVLIKDLESRMHDPAPRGRSAPHQAQA